MPILYGGWLILVFFNCPCFAPPPLLSLWLLRSKNINGAVCDARDVVSYQLSIAFEVITKII